MGNSIKQALIESIQEMDISKLEPLLDSNKTYQDASKFTFLHKLEEVFSTFKNSGESSLIAYNGFCNSALCPNKNCNGYSFVGKRTNKHFDLIVLENGNMIYDLFHCYGFEILDNSIVVEDSIEIDIKEDEKASFKITDEYNAKSRECEAAFSEIVQTYDEILSKHIWQKWLNDYLGLYQAISFDEINYAAFEGFYSLYNTLESLDKLLNLNELSIFALEKFRLVQVNSESELVNWLLEYEKFGTSGDMMAYYNTDLAYPIFSDFFQIGELKLNCYDFSNVLEFKVVFDQYYCTLLEHYSVININELLGVRKLNGSITIASVSSSFFMPGLD